LGNNGGLVGCMLDFLIWHWRKPLMYSVMKFFMFGHGPPIVRFSIIATVFGIPWCPAVVVSVEEGITPLFKSVVATTRLHFNKKKRAKNLVPSFPALMRVSLRQCRIIQCPFFVPRATIWSRRQPEGLYSIVALAFSWALRLPNLRRSHRSRNFGLILVQVGFRGAAGETNTWSGNTLTSSSSLSGIRSRPA